MYLLKVISMVVFCVGCMGYCLTNVLLLFADDFVYEHSYFFDSARNISLAVFLIGLILLMIVKFIRGKDREY